MTNVHRIKSQNKKNRAMHGYVYFSPVKSLWITSMYLIAIIGGIYTFSLEVFLVFLVTSAITLCLGHSLGMHRRFIHSSFECPLWLEYLFVYLGTIVGLAGPLGMMKTHDMRDWAQRQTKCHDYFAHKRGMLQDWFWQVHCDIQLNDEPEFKPESHISDDKVYAFMEKYWMWQQLPLALLLGAIGGLDWIIWGICVRVAVSVTGHWLIGYFAHNTGHKSWHVQGAAVQGYNIKHLGLITMGECWHNNHHAFPESAKLGLNKNEIDPGWWVLCFLQKINLVWNIKCPKDLPHRPELKSENKVASTENSLKTLAKKHVPSHG